MSDIDQAISKKKTDIKSTQDLITKNQTLLNVESNATKKSEIRNHINNLITRLNGLQADLVSLEQQKAQGETEPKEEEIDIDPFIHQPSIYDFTSGLAEIRKVGLFTFQLTGIGNGEVTVMVTHYKDKPLSSTLKILKGSKYHANVGETSFYYINWDPTFGVVGELIEFTDALNNPLRKYLVEKMADMTFKEESKKAKEGGGLIDRHRFKVIPGVPQWVRPKIRDYSIYREKLIFRDSLYNKYGKHILVVLSGLIIGSAIYKWSQDSDEDLKEYFKLKRAERRLQEKKAEGIIKKQEADRKRIKAMQMKDQAAQMEKEALKMDANSESVINSAERLGSAMSQRRKKLVKDPGKTKRLRKEIKELKSKVGKKQKLDQLLKEVEEKEDIKRLMGAPKSSIDELTIGAGTTPILKEVVKSGADVGKEVIKTGGALAKTGLDKLVPDVGGMLSDVTKIGAKAVLSDIPRTAIGVGKDLAKETIRGTSQVAGKAVSDVGKETVKGIAKVATGIPKSLAGLIDKRGDRKLARDFLKSKEKEGEDSDKDSKKSKVIMQRKEPTLEEKILDEKSKVDKEYEIDKEINNEILKIDDKDDLNEFINTYGGMQTHTSSNDITRKKYPEVGIFKSRKFNKMIHGDKMANKKRWMFVSDIDKMVKDGVDKYPGMDSDLAFKKIFNERYGKRGKMKNFIKQVEKTALPNKTLEQLKWIEDDRIDKALRRSEKYLVDTAKVRASKRRYYENILSSKGLDGLREALKKDWKVGESSKRFDIVNKKMKHVIDAGQTELNAIEKKIKEARKMGNKEEIIKLGDKYVDAERKLKKMIVDTSRIKKAPSEEEDKRSRLKIETDYLMEVSGREGKLNSDQRIVTSEEIMAFLPKLKNENVKKSLEHVLFRISRPRLKDSLLTSSSMAGMTHPELNALLESIRKDLNNPKTNLSKSDKRYLISSEEKVLAEINKKVKGTLMKKIQ